MLHQSTLHQSKPINAEIVATDLMNIFNDLSTKKQLAARLQVSVSFIEKLMAEEGLPHIKIGRSVRFCLKEVREWLNRRRLP